MYESNRRKWHFSTVLSVFFGASGVLGGAYSYGVAKEVKVAEIKVSLSDIEKSVLREREDRINADNAFRADINDIKQMQLEILKELRSHRGR